MCKTSYPLIEPFWYFHKSGPRVGLVNHNCRSCERKAGNRRGRAARLAAINHYGGACTCCGETRLAFLAIDHVNGNGKQHRKELAGNARKLSGSLIFRWLKRVGYPPGFQVLCHNCNVASALYGTCPHKVEAVV